MALIKCPDCGKMISSRALKCPDCGCPVEKPKRHNRICPECGQLVDMSDVATEKCENCGCPIAMFDKLQYKKNSELLNILDSLIVHKQGKLLKCPDCGKMISIRALQCPNCGCSHSMFVDNHNTIKDNATNVSTIQYTNTDGDFSALEREAKNGNTESMVRLASAYESGKGVGTKFTLAYYWYKKAAEMNNIDGMVNYARLLEVMDRRRDQAMIWAQKAKALGSNDVFTIIGDEQNRRLNNREAVFWYNLASQNKEIGAEWKKQSSSSFQVTFQNFQIKNNINWLKIMGVISLLVVFMFFFFSQDVFVGVKLTTPKNDGRICSELIHNAKTLKELEQASRKVYKYVDAYKEKLNNGEMSGPEVKEFFMEVGFVDAAINAQAAYIIEMGNNE